MNTLASLFALSIGLMSVTLGINMMHDLTSISNLKPVSIQARSLAQVDITCVQTEELINGDLYPHEVCN